jgi:hypothetical protein
MRLRTYITLVAALGLLLTMTVHVGACYSSGACMPVGAGAMPLYGSGVGTYLGCPGCPGCPDNPDRQPGAPGCYGLGCPGCPGCPDGNGTIANPGGPGCLAYGCL